ncbi:TnsA-like heteromeric transposase endonuclease subunit [Kitasatospora misakiensis]|uniref:TnsA-like heteromeric transposase endonuclease subunit n=1 Tax=Kitasatospora misakiensis TaxID=67330 RepID=A0ABW0XBX1_9ACTN
MSDGLRVRYRQADGAITEAPLDLLVVPEVVAGLPVREFRWYRGRQHYSGWYWASTGGRMVAYESRLELARILLADFDPLVAAIAAQPFQLVGPDGDRVRKHVPDLLLVYADGRVGVVDVKAASRMGDSKVSAQFAWTRRICAGQGWDYETWSGADPVLVENVRFLAGYRRPEVIDQDVVEQVREAVKGESTIAGVERDLSGRFPAGLVRPAVLHLVWAGMLTASLDRPLDAWTEVRPAGRGGWTA